MEISAAHARELEKQTERKAGLKVECDAAFEGVNRILFEAGCGHGHWCHDQCIDQGRDWRGDEGSS